MTPIDSGFGEADRISCRQKSRHAYRGRMHFSRTRSSGFDQNTCLVAETPHLLDSPSDTFSVSRDAEQVLADDATSPNGRYLLLRLAILKIEHDGFALLFREGPENAVIDRLRKVQIPVFYLVSVLTVVAGFEPDSAIVGDLFQI